MKGLQSPWVSGTLAVIAIGFVAYQFKPMWDRRARRAPAPEPAPAPLATATTAPVQQLPSSTPAAANVRGTVVPKGAATIDSSYVLRHLPEWLESPRRDPFLFYTAPDEPVVVLSGAPSPVQSWSLKSTWRQSGERRAVINKDVYREGDEIEGFLLERIDTDKVWLRGTNGVESLTFDHLKPPPPQGVSTNLVSTNSASTKPVTSNSVIKPGGRMERLERFLLGPQSERRPN